MVLTWLVVLAFVCLLYLVRMLLSRNLKQQRLKTKIKTKQIHQN